MTTSLSTKRPNFVVSYQGSVKYILGFNLTSYYLACLFFVVVKILTTLFQSKLDIEPKASSYSKCMSYCKSRYEQISFLP